MAKKTVKQDKQVEQVEQVEWQEVRVPYELLITAKVQVIDAHGNLFYLDPARKSGEFVLRVVPQPVPAETEALPPEWVRPEKPEKADGVIDWINLPGGAESDEDHEAPETESGAESDVVG